jgi:hypothetical protein
LILLVASDRSHRTRSFSGSQTPRSTTFDAADLVLVQRGTRFFDDRTYRRRDHDLAQRHFDFEFGMPIALCFTIWSHVGQVLARDETPSR